MTAPLSALDLQISQGQAVLGLLVRAQVPPLPRVYGLFYDYVAGVRSLVTARLGSILSDDSGSQARERVYAEFVGPYEHDESLDRMVNRMTARLAVLDKLMGESLQASAEHARSLADAHQQLEDPVLDGPLLAELVERLASATNELRLSNDLLSNQLAAAFDELEETRAELRRSGESARRDSLTGILNLAGIDVTLSQLLADAPTTGRSFSMALIDIDHFKSLNDGYGHQVGDEVLRIAARVLLATARGSDVVGRLGGDEFVVVLPDTGTEMAMDLANRICKAMRDYDLSALLGKDVVGGITVSVGVASYRDGDSIGAILERTDKAMYAAKSGGRNRSAQAS